MPVGDAGWRRRLATRVRPRRSRRRRSRARPDAAQRLGRDAEERGDVVLRDALHEIGAGAHELLVALAWRARADAQLLVDPLQELALHETPEQLAPRGVRRER